MRKPTALPPDFYDYSAARADTYHQITLPWTFFNWLNVTPRVGGRFTYYSAKPARAARTPKPYRTVFNTGIGASFKASQLWAGATNSFLQIDGLRHVIEPSANYVYVPNPSTPPSQLPQFDSALPSLLLLPVEFPDYNDIDSVDSENVIRFGLRNTLQTKRDGQLDNLLDWNLTLDWRLNPSGNASISTNRSARSRRSATFIPTSRSSRAPGSRSNRRCATTSTTAI